MATGIDVVLNLRSAREWHSTLEDSDSSAHWRSSAAAEEKLRRIEKIVAAAHAELPGLGTKLDRRIVSPLRDDLAIQEALIGRALQFLQRRQASGAFVEEEWRALTANTKVIEE